ncbi:pirin family protein [Flammeovirga sp. EKP202]|uniref:pirin family protein n=1 Tax=Flammeovirga sp. EKP202 TaxID=2770592 RepID=UPI00165F2C40|nr:pirin family protein [Flammeovirga sp. EKP202]MBD0402766.1 pirin family protein [Flammeovirga sp. EKP202]
MKRQLKRKQPGRNGFQFILDPSTRRELQPFVFFDAGKSKRRDEGMFFGMHPHSGIGIITYFEGGDLVHQDSGENDDIIRSGGVQWINAGGGIFHAEGYRKPLEEENEEWSLAIHQLWLQLPEYLEEGETGYQNVQPEEMTVVDNVKVIAGEYQGQKASLDLPYDITYLDISLKEGEEILIPTPKGQSKGFVFPREGKISLYDEDISSGYLSILEENEGELYFKAEKNAKFVVGMTAPTDQHIVVGGGSIHSSFEALNNSKDRIQKISMTLS